MDHCPCQGREHLVCRKGKIETAKVPQLCRGASMTTHKFPTLGQAVAKGLKVMPEGTYFKAEQRCPHGDYAGCKQACCSGLPRQCYCYICVERLLKKGALT